MIILLTSFLPFGGDALNASREVMNALPDAIPGAEIRKLCLPVVFGKAAELAVKAAEELRPDTVVCLGQAGGRPALTPERAALNLMDASLPDSDGFQPTDQPIVPGGPAAYFSTLPVRAMTEAIREAGVPAQISNTAGTYVCNHVMYSVLHWAAERSPDIPCGFIHVPYLDIQARGEGVPALPKEAAVRGILAALSALL